MSPPFLNYNINLTASQIFVIITARFIKTIFFLCAILYSGGENYMRNTLPVLKSLELIETRISEKLTVKNIADGVFFSRYHYGRLFREIIGENVMEYVTKRKLTLAGKELTETNASILDIALRYGYDSHEGFTRSFKAYMGVTPTAYRKYNLTSISRNIIKEKIIMTYSKNTDEIIRGLNAFIAQARELATLARTPEFPFWDRIAILTDELADRTNTVNSYITNIAEHPDEITNRFWIVKIIEDTAFTSNLLAFGVNLTVSRSLPEHIAEQKPLCEKYIELAKMQVDNVSNAIQFFNELSKLIFDDMRKSVSEKITDIISKGRTAAGCITGYSYIKNELEGLINTFSETPVEKISISLLEDYYFKLNIISFAAYIDVFRNPDDKIMVENLKVLGESFSEAIEYMKTLPKPESNPIIETTVKKQFADIAYQVNVLLFFIRGEIDEKKLGAFINDTQKSAFNAICEKMNEAIQLAHNATEQTEFKKISDRLFEIKSDLMTQAEILKERGGAVEYLSCEIGYMAERAAGRD
jgi:AraC family transcriptional regulator